MDFWAGYLSGAIGIVVGNPLDILKVRIQSSNSRSGQDANVHAHSQHASPSRRALLKGVAAPILTYGALNALLFATYNRALPLFPAPVPSPAYVPHSLQEDRPDHTYTAQFISGVIAGLATFVISTPTELVKCRAQLASTASPTSLPTAPPTSSYQIARAIFSRHGFGGFYHGGIVTALRDGIGYGFYFLSYEASKDWWARHVQHDGMWNEQAKVLVCGGLAGVVTWASVFPLDVVKSRVQTHPSFLPSKPHIVMPGVAPAIVAHESQPLLPATSLAAHGKSPGAWAVTRHAYATEGLGVFFRGLGVCSVRAFIVNAVQWSVYELVMKNFA
jgi:solute carrier family 25 carnitine/acylcarnitine transporter 20/29